MTALLTHRTTRGSITTQPYGANPTRNNPHPIYGDYQRVGHLGRDEAGDVGEPIFAAAAGRVVYAGPGELMPAALATRWGYFAGPAGWASGNITLLEHSPSFGTSYSHQSRVTAPAGTWLSGGDKLGEIGSTGRSTGPHLHLEAILLPVTYLNEYYGRIDPAALYTGGVSVVGELEDDMGLTADQNNALRAVFERSGRANQILEALDVNVNGAGKVQQLIGTINALAAAVGKPDVDVEKLIRETLEETASTHYVKAKEDATVYALSPDTGKLRPVKLPEWNVAHAAGIPLRIVPQKFIDAAPKEAIQ